jgi:hypothetical protein
VIKAEIVGISRAYIWRDFFLIQVQVERTIFVIYLFRKFLIFTITSYSQLFYFPAYSTESNRFSNFRQIFENLQYRYIAFVAHKH